MFDAVAGRDGGRCPNTAARFPADLPPNSTLSSPPLLLNAINRRAIKRRQIARHRRIYDCFTKRLEPPPHHRFGRRRSLRLS